jgi:hypothetical protein
MGRIYQDFSFIVVEAVGRPILRICGAVNLEAQNNYYPIVVYARLDNPPEWHRFFLDAGAAFWEIWSDAEIADEHNDESYHLVDYFSEILPLTIERAYAVELRSAPSKIILSFDNEYSIQLACIDDTSDAPTQISIHRILSEL